MPQAYSTVHGERRTSMRAHTHCLDALFGRAAAPLITTVRVQVASQSAAARPNKSLHKADNSCTLT